MRRWWCKKYQLPPTSPLYLAYTREQLFIEFMEDIYENPPPGGVPLDLGDHLVFKTGDPVVDKWEEQYARGEMPDLDALLTPEETAKLEAEAREHDGGGFEDNYAAVDGRIEAETQSASVTPPSVKK